MPESQEPNETSLERFLVRMKPMRLFLSSFHSSESDEYQFTESGCQIFSTSQMETRHGYHFMVFDAPRVFKKINR